MLREKKQRNRLIGIGCMEKFWFYFITDPTEGQNLKEISQCFDSPMPPRTNT